MRIYIAGKIGTEYEKELLEKVNRLCKSLKLKTFLPHLDVGVAQSLNDVEKVFEGDIIEGLNNCDLVIAVLDGLHVGSGTAWELGYAYAKNIPAIGIKTDESIKDGFEYLSPIIIASMQIVSTFGELKDKIKEIINLKVL